MQSFDGIHLQVLNCLKETCADLIDADCVVFGRPNPYSSNFELVMHIIPSRYYPNFSVAYDIQIHSNKWSRLDEVLWRIFEAAKFRQATYATANKEIELPDGILSIPSFIFDFEESKGGSIAYRCTSTMTFSPKNAS